MTDILSSIEALIGKKIISITMMDAEIARTVKEYALVKCVDERGNEERIILLMAKVVKPCPDDIAMLEELVSGNGFFAPAEILARRQGKPLPIVIMPGLDDLMMVKDEEAKA